jgi:hypothetical protein
MKKIVLLVLVVSIINSCKEKVHKETNTDNMEKTSNEKNVVRKKHKDERLFKGMFSYVAKTNEIAFYECNQEVTISVIPLKQGDFNILFEAYKKVQEDKILDFAYVEFNGYKTDKLVASEMEDMKTIRITKFLRIDKNKSCD